MNKTISGYITLRNPVEMGYPFDTSIRSLFSFCDEIVVCNTGDGKDGTEEILEALKNEFKGSLGFKVVRNPECNYSAPNHGIYDGQNKAYAREHCTGDFCFQIDADEVAENFNKEWLHKFISKLQGQNILTEENPIIGFPVVEPWGSNGKIRCDINPWKERLSVNFPKLTHGIPLQLRVYKDGLLYAAPKTTDGCNLIHKDSGNPARVIMLQDVLNLAPGYSPQRISYIKSKAAFNTESNVLYYDIFNCFIDKLPFMWHYSWYSIASKIRKYKLFWHSSWDSLYGELNQNPPGFPFFDKPWEDVTDEDINEMADKLEAECGGHIFHTPWNGTKTLWIYLKNKEIPKITIPKKP